MRRIALAVGAVVVLLGAALLLRDGQAIRPGDMARLAKAEGAAWKPAPQRHSAEVVLSIVPGAGRTSAAAPVPALSPLMAEVAAARDYRPIHDRLVAKANRSPEETYVLADLLEKCAKVTDRKNRSATRMTMAGEEPRRRFLASLSDKDPQREKRLAAFEIVSRDPCDGLLGVETTEKAIRDLIREAAAAGDPKARLVEVRTQILDSVTDEQGRWRAGQMPAITDAQLEVVRTAVSSGDPHALREAASVLTFPFANLSIRTGAQEIPVDGSAFNDAWMLAACAHGYPCGPQMRHLAESCALFGQCGASDYREFLFYYRNSPRQSQLLDEYTAYVLRAARGDWSGFSFHRAPSPWASFVPRQR